MKISVSLSDADVSFLDGYATEVALGSRSAALQRPWPSCARSS